MGRRPYTCDPGTYNRHYCNQAGGGGEYFKGHLVQKGFGNILGALIRRAVPLVKHIIKSPIGKAIGKQALKSGKHLLGDLVVRRKPLKTAVKRRAKEAVKIDGKLAEMLLGTKGKARKRVKRDVLGD